MATSYKIWMSLIFEKFQNLCRAAEMSVVNSLASDYICHLKQVNISPPPFVHMYICTCGCEELVFTTESSGEVLLHGSATAAALSSAQEVLTKLPRLTLAGRRLKDSWPCRNPRQHSHAINSLSLVAETIPFSTWLMNMKKQNCLWANGLGELVTVSHSLLPSCIPVGHKLA